MTIQILFVRFLRARFIVMAERTDLMYRLPTNSRRWRRMLLEVLAVESKLDQEGRVLISISDSGVGLPTDNTDQILNAFFTTKPNGSGMRLAISRSTIESRDGRLWATRNSALGATFHFTLPTASDAKKVPAVGA